MVLYNLASCKINNILMHIVSFRPIRMRRQVSTAMSDLVLALSAVWGFRMLHDARGSEHQFGKWWFMLETLAASLGVVRFGACKECHYSIFVSYYYSFVVCKGN